MVAKKLQPKATEVAMASTVTSLKISLLEGKKFGGGSVRYFTEESGERGGLALALGFGRFFEVEDIFSFRQRNESFSYLYILNLLKHEFLLPPRT